MGRPHQAPTSPPRNHYPDPRHTDVGQQRRVESSQNHFESPQRRVESSQNHFESPQRRVESSQNHFESPQRRVESSQNHFESPQRRVESSQNHFESPQQRVVDPQRSMFSAQRPMFCPRRPLRPPRADSVSGRGSPAMIGRGGGGWVVVGWCWGDGLGGWAGGVVGWGGGVRAFSDRPNVPVQEPARAARRPSYSHPSANAVWKARKSKMVSSPSPSKSARRSPVPKAVWKAR